MQFTVHLSFVSLDNAIETNSRSRFKFYNMPSVISAPSPIDSDDSDGEARGIFRQRNRNRDRRAGNYSGNTRPTADSLREALCRKIQADLENKCNSDEIKERNKNSIGECLSVREESGNPTILHWIVSQAEGRRVDFGQKHPPKDGFSWEALKVATDLSLELSPDLLRVQDNKLKDTALHRALRLAVERRSESDYDNFIFCQNLAKHMCKSTSNTAAREAISVINVRNETCIHVAVAGELDSEVTNLLVELADVRTLMMPRKSDKSNDGKVWQSTNTALHDAVAYERCLVQECTCPSDESCPDRIDLEEQMYKSRERVLELVQLLIRKAPGALSATNANDQSPYLYHRYARDQDKATTRAQNTSSHRPEILDIISPAAPAISFAGLLRPPRHPSFIPDHPRADGKRGTPGKFTSQKFETITEKSNPHQNPATQNNMGPPPIPLRNGVKDAKPPTLPSEQDGGCPNLVMSSKIATEVESYLLKSAFTIRGGFKEVCNCFYGKRRDKNYKTPTFMPGHALGGDEKDCYEFLGMSTIMSQVHLIVPWTKAGEFEDGQKEEEILRIMRGLWDDDMESMRSAFTMLEKKGVERILKLIVSDNKERPCSDEVIVDCIKRFDVRYLDWRKEDLSADAVLSAAPNLTELWLYSSGRSAVLQGWAASKALCNLNQVGFITVLFIRVSRS